MAKSIVYECLRGQTRQILSREDANQPGWVNLSWGDAARLSSAAGWLAQGLGLPNPDDLLVRCWRESRTFYVELKDPQDGKLLAEMHLSLKQAAKRFIQS